MKARFEIISDRVEVVFRPEDGRRHVRMLILRDCDSRWPLRNAAEFVLPHEQARAFARVFARSSEGRFLTLAIRDLRLAGMGGLLRIKGQVMDVR